MTKDVGVHGNLFGGTMMSWLDEAGAAYVSQKIDTSRVVTLKISEAMFPEPIKVGQIVKIYGEILKIGNTSIAIRLEARRHKPNTGKQKVACGVEMVFVRIDEDGEPTPINEKIKRKFNK
jgi:acyl-CoA thioesterase YciA